MALTIRTLTEGDFDAVNLILQASYGDGNDRIPRLYRYTGLQPDGWFLAVLDDLPVGVVGAIDYGPFAYSGLLGVHPYAQRRGAGTALMQHILDWLQARNCPMVLVDTAPASVPLYRKLGFVGNDDVWMFRNDLVLASNLSSRAQLMRVEDIAALAAFDEPLFGARRGTLFEEVFGECAGNAFVTRDGNGQIGGYLFAQAKVIGPWAAGTEADAEALLSAGLACYAGRAAQVIVPAANHTSRPLLQRYGFRPQFALRHMRRGGAAHPGDRTRLYGQTSFVAG